jgi:OOP family OmpA-OmpF porin
VGAGQAEARSLCDSVPGVTINSCDDEDSSWRIFAGYQFNKYVGLELGYADLGQGEGRATVTGVGSGTARFEAEAWDLVMVGMLPINERFSIFGKLGFARWDVDASATVSIPGRGTGVGSDSEDGTELTQGVGAQFNFTKNVGARVEWQRYNDVGGSKTGESDIDVISASLLFTF